MAALAITTQTRKAPLGKYWLQSFFVTTTAGAVIEWIPTGMNRIEAVLGYAVIGTAGSASTANFLKNATTQASGANSSGGDLSIETVGAVDIWVTVLGE